jgi:predicted dithiol-disulfide oxidoreductase (DUF899 family)
MPSHTIVSREEWRKARKAHPAKEKEFTRLRDQLSAERRALPWVREEGYARGLDMLVGAYNYLDLVPKGRDEDAPAFTMAWVRHHDRYGDGAGRSQG